MKNLDYKVISFQNGIVCFFINEQRFRREKFYKNGCRFVDSKGFILMSQGMPENSLTCDNLFFVRGLNERRDEDKITMSLEKFLSFANAVKEYNEQTLKHGEDEYNED